MSRRTCRTTRNLNEDEEDPEITSGDEAEREYERHADEPTDSEDVINEKVATLVDLMKTCHTKLIYTGAGISTAANIPDYRGPGGVYTLAKKGIAVTCHDIVSQSPTSSHLVIKELYRHRYISHIVSQNCDGMHLRSGIPQCGLSEIHGNMHIEVCSSCPDRQFIRKFDVTEDSGYRAHTTRRVCQCGSPLRDTIVHYGERGKARYPLNWEAAQEIVPEADLIICIGSSLQVLKDYKFLWPAAGSNAKIVIINLQWTPKDADASLVIRGDCEKVLTKLAQGLEIDIKHYCRDCDPILTARRNTRNGELLMKMTDCMCHLRPPRTAVAGQSEQEAQQYCPGWWRVGMKAICKEADRARRSNTKEDSGYDEQNRDPSSNTPSPPVNADAPRKRGRPRKRKVSADEIEEPAQRGRRRASAADDTAYEPERRHQRRAPAPASLRATRSSGVADDHPLVGDFRKKRHDAGRRRGGVEAAEEEQSPTTSTETSTEDALAIPAEELIEEEIIEEEELIEEEDVEVEIVEEDEDVDVEEFEEVVEEVEEDEAMMLDEPLSALEDVPLSSLTETVVHRPFARRQPISRDDEDVYIDVVGDFDEEDEIVYENEESIVPNDSALFNDEADAFRENGSSSLSMSLSQLNGSIPNEQGDGGGPIGEQSLALDVFDFQEAQNDLMEHPPRRRYDAHSARFVTTNGYRRNRYANETAAPSTSNYFDDNLLSPNDINLFDPSTSAFTAPSQSTQLKFVKNSEKASTSATLPLKYQRGPRRKKAPDTNSVEFFLRQINGARPVEATSIGAIYEQARQIVNPEEDERQFQTTLISAVRDQLGVQELPAIPEKKPKAKRSPKKPPVVAIPAVPINPSSIELQGECS